MIYMIGSVGEDSGFPASSAGQALLEFIPMEIGAGMTSPFTLSTNRFPYVYKWFLRNTRHLACSVSLIYAGCIPTFSFETSVLSPKLPYRGAFNRQKPF